MIKKCVYCNSPFIKVVERKKVRKWLGSLTINLRILNIKIEGGDKEKVLEKKKWKTVVCNHCGKYLLIDDKDIVKNFADLILREKISSINPKKEKIIKEKMKRIGIRMKSLSGRDAFAVSFLRHKNFRRIKDWLDMEKGEIDLFLRKSRREFYFSMTYDKKEKKYVINDFNVVIK